MELSRQGYWSGLPFPSPADLLNPGIEPTSPVLQADSFRPLGRPHLKRYLPPTIRLIHLPLPPPPCLHLLQLPSLVVGSGKVHVSPPS